MQWVLIAESQGCNFKYPVGVSPGLKSLLMSKIMKSKRDLELVTNLALGCKFCVKKNSFFVNPSPGQCWWFNTKWFLCYSKYCIYKFMQSNSQPDNYSSFIWPFERTEKRKKLEIKEKNNKKFNIFRTKVAFWIK